MRMFLIFENKLSDSPFAERVWRSHSERALAGASKHAFWSNGSAWEYPDFENADAFVARLARKGVIARDAIVDAVFPVLLGVMSCLGLYLRDARVSALIPFRTWSL